MINKMYEFISQQKYGILTSLNDEGYPFSRAMTITHQENNKEFYFITPKNSVKYVQLKNDKRASLYFFNENNYNAVNLTGDVEIFDEGEIKKNLWHKINSLTLYKDNDNDYADFCIIKFTAKRARYLTALTSYNFLLEI